MASLPVHPEVPHYMASLHGLTTWPRSLQILYYMASLPIDPEQEPVHQDAVQLFASVLLPSPPSAALSDASKVEFLGSVVPGAFVVRSLFADEEVTALRRVVDAAHDSQTRRDGPDQETTTTRRFSQHHRPVRVPSSAMQPLCARLRPFLPQTAGPGAEDCKLLDPGLEVSPFLRCYDYLTGDGSSPHFDRSFTEHCKKTGAQLSFSAFSILLYLSDSAENSGGGTTFFERDEAWQVSKGGLNVVNFERESLREAATVTPRAGDVLVFPHGNHPGCWPNPLHEGSVVESGGKSLIRTDALYASAPPRRGTRRKAG